MLVQKVCLPHMSPPDTRLFDFTYLNTENYTIYIAFLQHPNLETKQNKKQNKTKQKQRPTDPSNFQAKRANNSLFFRSNIQIKNKQTNKTKTKTKQKKKQRPTDPSNFQA